MEYAVNPINMCIQGATVIDNYYMIREACNNNDVKKIILELDYQYWNKNLKRDSDFGDLLVYGQLPFSTLKMEYIVNQLMDKDFRTIYFRRYAFAKNWKTAKKYMAINTTALTYFNILLLIAPRFNCLYALIITAVKIF